MKPIRMTAVLLSLALASVLLATNAANAQVDEPSPAVLFLVDVSGSMGGSRLIAAQDALRAGVAGLGEEQSAGLRSFAGSCGNLGNNLVSPEPGTSAALLAAINGLRAGGGTPTPTALLGAANDLTAITGPKVIVLISDGQSSCGDPCPTAELVKDRLGVDFRTVTVGFQASAATAGELACIADVTGGTYFSADDTEGLTDAIGEAIESSDDFVYAAFGDSYSSGEGNPPFENGNNYPDAIEQENTLTRFFDGDSCHRSLRNYAKINRDLLSSDPSPILVDRTCSGALIAPEPGGKAPISPSNLVIGQPTQVDQAIDRLDRLHDLEPTDVDLVTVSMGGNDGGFGNVIAACLLPNVVRELIREVDNGPVELGVIESIINNFGLCGQIDQRLGDSRSAIAELGPKQRAGQMGLLNSFDQAEILQLTYPNAVPVADDFPGETCGGLLPGDADYARETATLINDVVRSEVAARTVESNGRYQLVDIEQAFGENALCPADPAQQLLVGIDQDRLESLVQELLEPGSSTRQLVDNLLDAYGRYRNCRIDPRSYFNSARCDGRFAELTAALDAVTLELQARQDELIGKMVEGDTVAERFENSRNLFHPNDAGFEVMACHVRATFLGEPVAGCATPAAAKTYIVDGAAITDRTPVEAEPGQTITFEFNAFGINVEVEVTVYSEPQRLGTFGSDANGTISGEVVLPQNLTPGVHRLEFSGPSAAGVPRTVEVLIDVPGDPIAGEEYGVFLCCFPNDEQVQITSELTGFGTANEGIRTVDRDGGIYFSTVVPAAEEDGNFSITAVGLTTGQVESANAGAVVTTGLCAGLVPTIVGTDGPDRLVGTNKADVILAGAGNDVIIGKNGKDIICAGTGDDTVHGGNGIDLIRGGPGNDTLNGDNGDDEILGDTGSDTINGDRGDDVLAGGPGNDVVVGGRGTDTCTAVEEVNSCE